MGATVLIADIDKEKGEKAAGDMIDDIRTLLETIDTRN